ncbi:MAG: hypothetical protein RLQ73_17235 [Hoeflea sp. D1-CHI-28]
MLKQAILVLPLLFLPVLAAEAESSKADKADHGSEHAHGATGPNGGALQELGNYEAELLTGNGEVVLYLLDRQSDLPVDTAGMQANALVVQGSERQGVIALQPAGNRLRGSGELPAGADAIVSLRTKDGRTAQARFELGGHDH